jgi:SAM-dependent methyltransferase
MDSGSGMKTVASEHYTDDFYDGLISGTLRSAARYVDFLSTLYRPMSVVDLGCGRGTWLKAFRDGGAKKVVGFDGPWNTQTNMVDQAIEFHAVDLNKPISTDRMERFDLAISLEVAEHLEASSASTFIDSLTRLSDVILFGAAFTLQGGTGHINEQPHTYWAQKFALHGYEPYDLFRPLFWGDEDVEYWYQQNIFLYVRKNSPIAGLLSSAGHPAMKNIKFMDCVHPTLYLERIQEVSIGAHIKRLAINVIPRPLRPLAQRIKRAVS